MKHCTRKLSACFVLLSSLFVCTAGAATDGTLKLPNFDALARNATQSVVVTLDSDLLGIAAGFLDSDDPDEAAVREIVGGLKGVYVRSYTFNKDFGYPSAQVEAVRKQLTAPGWQQLVRVRGAGQQGDVDIYLSIDHGKANGLAIIASEPRQFTIVNIVGSIDLEKLHRLQGKLGIPKLPAAGG